MASLLDVIVARNNPQLGGLLGTDREGTSGSADALSPRQSPQGGGGILGQLFGGRDDPRLSPEANASARQQAMLQAGLATLASGGGFGQPQGLQRLAMGALVGQQAGAQAREEAVEAGLEAREVALQAKIGQLFGDSAEGVNRETASRALQLAIAAGDQETAKNINEFIKTLPEPDQPAEPKTVNLADGTVAVFDPNERTFYDASGEVLTELPKDVAKDDDQLQFVQGVDPATQEPVAGVVNLDQNTFTPISGIAGASAAKSRKYDPETIDTAAEATKARANIGTIRGFLEGQIEKNPQNPLRGIRFDRARFEETGLLVPLAQRQRLDTETQQFLQAQEAFMLQLANKLAGVRGVSSESARAAIFRTYGFEEGDSVENIRNTLRELEIGVRSLELQAGSALKLFENVDVGDEGGSDNPFNSVVGG